MGSCCTTSPDRLQDIGVSKELESDKLNSSKIQKLLFLGSGGSGKSTFFKQLKCIHGQGFTNKDRLIFKEHISAQIIEQINRAVECIPYYNERLPPDYQPIGLTKEGEEAARFLEDFGPDTLINEEIAHHIEVLWDENSVKQIYKNRAIYHIDDSSEYFFNEISRIGQPNYTPTDKDILLVRYRTTGVIESKFKILNSQFHVFDVGGQQSERKKWIHCFENVTAVIFVASLSCYDELMFEDDTRNCMHDSLELFQEICNLQWFINTPIILFLNKKDLFETKINIIPLSVCFPQYQPKNIQQSPKHNNNNNNDNDNNNNNNDDDENHIILDNNNNNNNVSQYCIESRGYIKKKFEASNDNQENRAIYTHLTCATNKNNVENVFNDVQQIVVTAGLQRNNIL